MEEGRLARNRPLSLKAPLAPRSVLGDYLALTKPRLSGLVVFTAAGGMGLAPHWPPAIVWFATILGIALIVGAANAFNEILERDVDGLMERTANRPLPTGRLSMNQALPFALVLAGVGTMMLAVFANLTTAVLGVVALGCYALVYTPLKKQSHWAMEVGGIAGALPPLIGWTAATGKIDGGGLVLAAILFTWQMPHFIAIALFRKAEYAKAGLTNLPLAIGDAAAQRHAILWTVALILMSIAPMPVGLAGSGYAITAGVLDVALFACAIFQRKEPFWAKRLFLASLVYLTLLFVALGVDRAWR